MGDVLLNAPLVGGMLPSPSVLTGIYRPLMAAACMEQTLAEAKARAAGSRLGTPALPQPQAYPQPQANVLEVSALRSMAARHLGNLRQAPPSPYTMQQPPLPSRCLSTPPLRSHPATPPPPHTPLLLASQPQHQVQQQQQHPLKVSFDLTRRDLTAAAAASCGGGPAMPTSRAGGLHHSAHLGVSAAGTAAADTAAADTAAADTAAANTAGIPDSPTAAVSTQPSTVAVNGGAPASPERPPHNHTHGMITACSSHPLFTAHQTLPRLALPADELVVAAAAPPTTALASPVAALLAGGGIDGGCAASGAASPLGCRLEPSQQQHPLSPAQAAAATAPPLLPPQQQPSPHAAARPHPLLMPRFLSHASPHSSRPSTSISVQDLCLPRPGTRYPSRSPTRGSMTQILDLSRAGSASSGCAATTASSRVLTAASFASARLSSPASSTQHPGGGDAAFAAGANPSVVATPGRAATRFNHAATRWASEAAAAAAAAQDGGEAARLTRGGFKVTRGMLYSVFQELDEFDSGRLTYSAFEQAACKIGMRPPQAKRLFEHLDPQSRGFATLREWSSPHLQRQMEAFTRLYVQATRGSDGRPKDITEVRSMHMAVQMAMVKLQLKRCGRAVSLDRLVQAFAYMDRDSNGALNAEEVEDALNSLGIFVTPEVVGTIMRTFDKDGNGAVDYYEFVKSLYPTLDTGVYHQ